MADPFPENPAEAFSVRNKVVILTGAGGGIGLGIASTFAKAGAQVLAVVRREESRRAVLAQSPNATVLKADLADANAADAIMSACLSTFGRADVLINNAALVEARPLASLTPDYIDHIAAINLKTPLLLCRAFAMAATDGTARRKIINIGSIEGLVATMPAGMAAYSATKTALRGLTVTLARELGPLNIGVNAITPGGVIHENLIRDTDGSPTEEELQAVSRGLQSRISAGRLGSPLDIALLCVFLASQAADYLVGQTIVADGGYTVG